MNYDVSSVTSDAALPHIRSNHSLLYSTTVGLHDTPAFFVFTFSIIIDQGGRSLWSPSNWRHGAAEVPFTFSSSCPAFISAAPIGVAVWGRYDRSAEQRLR